MLLQEFSQILATTTISTSQEEKILEIVKSISTSPKVI